MGVDYTTCGECSDISSDCGHHGFCRNDHFICEPCFESFPKNKYEKKESNKKCSKCFRKEIKEKDANDLRLFKILIKDIEQNKDAVQIMADFRTGQQRYEEEEKQRHEEEEQGLKEDEEDEEEDSEELEFNFDEGKEGLQELLSEWQEDQQNLQEGVMKIFQTEEFLETFPKNHKLVIIGDGDKPERESHSVLIVEQQEPVPKKKTNPFCKSGKNSVKFEKKMRDKRLNFKN